MANPLVNNRCTSFFEVPGQSCSECGNPMGIFTCHGCSKAFCEQHSVEHRNSLQAQLRDLRNKNHTLETDANMGRLDSECSHLLEKIERWRRESIDKIEQAAAEAKRKVLNVLNVNGQGQLNQLLQCRKVFTARLQQAEVKKDFHETHLKYWYQYFDDLQQNFNRFQASYARYEYCTTPFISKLIIHENTAKFRYTKWCSYERNGVQLTDIRRSEHFQEQNYTRNFGIEPCESSYSGNVDKVVRFRHSKHSQEHNYARLNDIEPCDCSYSWFYGKVDDLTRSTYQTSYLDGARELWTGEYRFRLGTDCLFIGIISKSAETSRESLNTRSVYGWNGNDAVYLDGIMQRGYRGYQSDMQAGDIVSLIVNCERQVIRLKNVTKNTTYELSIDVEKCPLPWLFKVRFFERD